jgi:HSP20 family protein
MNLEYRLAGGGPSYLSTQVARWVEDVLGPDYRRYRTQQTWSPPINLYEDEECYCLVVDLAGVDSRGIDLHVEKDRLVLNGERPTPRPPRRGRVSCPPNTGRHRLHLMEIDHGPFLRTLKLPRQVDPERIEAQYRKGFLWVRMPKKS